ncbi:reverse transcriptase domain-containing protein [Tanacetum coccineum]
MARQSNRAQDFTISIEGYKDAIVVPPINANNFELKQTLINLVQGNQFTGKQDPHNHLQFFNKVTSTFRHPEVPNTSIKLLLFPFSLEGLLRQCPHHGFLELHQLDTFYNSLNTNDQDALDSAASGNFLDKMPCDGLAIIESKSKSYAKANDANMNNLQMNTATTSRSGTLPSQTVTNPREHVNAITTRSGKTCEGPSTPLVPTPVVSIPSKEPEQNPETSMDKVQKPSSESTAQVPPPEEEESIFMEIPKPKAKKTVNVEIHEHNSPRPTSYQPKLPYPERMKVRENYKPSAQHSRFLKMFKQLRLEIGLKDALVEMPKFNKWLSSLLRNKEKLEEIAITTVNAKCSAIIMNKVPKKLEDLGKFLIPCVLQELDRTSALADFRASINLLPHSIYKQIGLEALNPTQMTLELANRSVTHPMGIAEDVVVRVDGFTFLADFVVVNFQPNPRVPIILGRPFLRTAKALIDLYEEKLTLRVGKEELVYYADKSEKNKEQKFVHAISIIDYIFKKDLTVSLDSTESSIFPPPLLDSDSPFTVELSASTTFNSLGNEDKVFKPGILVYHAIHDKNLVTLEENSKENISFGTLLFFKKLSFLLPPPEPPDDFLNFEPNLVMKNVMLNEDFYQSKKTLPLNVEDVNSFAFVIWTFLPYFTYTEESPLFISFRSEDFVFDPGIVTFHFSYLKPLAF